MAILSKACKPDNFESHNSLKLSFTNIRGLRSNFVDCESFLESDSPDILILIDCMIFLSPFLNVTRMSMATVSFLAQLDSGILCL